MTKTILIDYLVKNEGSINMAIVSEMLDQLIESTTSGTATAADILNGKTAYVNGSKLTGTCTYDADTSDADAVAEDLALDKTAYVNGVKLVGTAV
jgi:FMN-dependent NADH-azoreductase